MVDQFIPSPNYRPGRTKAITAIVIHYTGAMRLESTIDWFRRPESKVSAHYVIGRDGHVVQMVKDSDVAWHAGRSAMHPELEDRDPLKEMNVNTFSLGIELVGTADSGFEPAQLTALYGLLVQLVVKYRVRPDRVVGHCHVSPGRKQDPDGYHHQFPWVECRRVCDQAYASTLTALPPQPPPPCAV